MGRLPPRGDSLQGLHRSTRRSSPWIPSYRLWPRSASTSARNSYHVGFSTDGRIAFRRKIKRSVGTESANHRRHARPYQGSRRSQQARRPRVCPSLALSRNTPKDTWDLRHVDGAECGEAFEPRFVTDDMAALRLAAERGNGIVQLPVYMVSEQLHAGSLVAVLPDRESGFWNHSRGSFFAPGGNLRPCEALSISPAKPLRLLVRIRPSITEAPRIQSQSAACLPQINSLNRSRLNPFTELTSV